MPVDLDELERLLAEATPGPWRVRYSNGGGDERCGYISARETAHRDREVLDVGEVGDQRMENDLDAIVAMRNNFGALLAELRACRAERDAAVTRQWFAEGRRDDALAERDVALARAEKAEAGLAILGTETALVTAFSERDALRPQPRPIPRAALVVAGDALADAMRAFAAAHRRAADAHLAPRASFEASRDAELARDALLAAVVAYVEAPPSPCVCVGACWCVTVPAYRAQEGGG